MIHTVTYSASTDLNSTLAAITSHKAVPVYITNKVVALMAVTFCYPDLSASSQLDMTGWIWKTKQIESSESLRTNRFLWVILIAEFMINTVTAELLN